MGGRGSVGGDPDASAYAWYEVTTQKVAGECLSASSVTGDDKTCGTLLLAFRSHPTASTLHSAVPSGMQLLHVPV